MNNPTAGTQIKAARVKKQWKPSVLARQTGLAQSRLCKFENESAYPTPKEWALLQSCLELGPYTARQTLELPSVRRRWFPEYPPLPEGERPFSIRQAAAKKTFGLLADKALLAVKVRPDHKLCYKFLEDATLESGDEAMFWVTLLAKGARPGRHSPHRAGFRKFSIIDPKLKEVRGDLKLPCLDLDFPDFEALLFPQVTLDTRSRIYRLDALASLWHPGSRLWVNIEIDGQGHVSTYDKERESNLGLPTERIVTTDLAQADFYGALTRRLRAHFGLPEAG